MIAGALLLGGTVFGGIVSFDKINEIIQTTGINNSLLIPYVEFKGNNNYRPLSENYALIAPTKLTYGVNDILLARFFSSQFANQQVKNLQLDCGNGKQLLQYNSKAQQFNGSCLYMNK